MRLLFAYLFFTSLIMTFGSMIVLWTFSLAFPQKRIEKLSWPIAVSCVAATCFFMGDGDSFRLQLFFGLILAWACFPKNAPLIRGKSSLLHYLGRGASILLLTFPFYLLTIDFNPQISWITWVGVATIICSLLGQLVSQIQLRRFLKNPLNSNHICREGVWGRTRHPYLFFEWMTWIGFSLFILPSPWGLASWILSTGMLFFYFFRKIPQNEKALVKTYQKEYLVYQKEVSAFFPKGSK